MHDKSHVSLEQHVCLVCGTAFDTGAILLDKRLRASMERHTTTGWGLCPEHQKLFDDGFVALVECDPQRSGSQAGGRMKPEQAYRTGRLACGATRHFFCCARCRHLRACGVSPPSGFHRSLAPLG